MRNSFEEVRLIPNFKNASLVLTVASQQVMQLQASKKQLAGVVLAPHDADKTGDNLGSLHVG